MYREWEITGFLSKLVYPKDYIYFESAGGLFTYDFCLLFKCVLISVIESNR